MGGDNAPESAVWGAALAAREYGEEVLLVGRSETVEAVLKGEGVGGYAGVTIVVPALTWWICTTIRRLCCAKAGFPRWRWRSLLKR